ncbi:DUF3040 domain-containing protein [Corynebacterium sp. ES2794-CONJ1]|uniref:DUF3040 domain-containing protein n=1 Tax=unclassified Corynebacterium TaxID=2624378 RepID=UPI0021672AF3|nr:MULTISPECIES: DUF3040 domain-containing protein [unclassified Corynebacterium]MCS4489005.1 DUF3040 domain-containing protein [Corynebacterium sp. ES2775-CONJ]MCS4490818.1 DUF3040 domain-containing protein [Corynebacterium sp. ES2715-CONJ3]MCS4531299.1 DUF3040 domain-containing protein [Corynebacterium sp. ES2730-CONJ]MCU9518668.1 DUF3040 domain-containing protein [Corynebacterium sp. ES2794-CONJ1]
MSLSEHEQELLKEIERSLLAEDPHFGKSVPRGEAHSALSFRGFAVIVIGLVMLVGGVALSQISLWLVALSIVGFVVMVAGAIWMLSGDGASSGLTKREKTLPRPVKDDGLGSRMEENFRKRFEK